MMGEPGKDDLEVGVNVRTFLSEIMNQILDGIHDIDLHHRGKNKEIVVTVDVGNEDEVLFDVEVTAVADTSVKGGFQLKVPFAGVNLGGDAASSHQVSNRVQFKLRVYRMTKEEADKAGLT